MYCTDTSPETHTPETSRRRAASPATTQVPAQWLSQRGHKCASSDCQRSTRLPVFSAEKHSAYILNISYLLLLRTFILLRIPSIYGTKMYFAKNLVLPSLIFKLKIRVVNINSQELASLCSKGFCCLKGSGGSTILNGGVRLGQHAILGVPNVFSTTVTYHRDPHHFWHTYNNKYKNTHSALMYIFNSTFIKFLFCLTKIFV